jgi:four helix bundle protein
MGNGNGDQINSHKDLEVWKLGMDLAHSCYQATRQFPKEELFGLTSQIRRASVSIPANIAEGYGRETRGAYIRGLRIAQGSLKELETHLLLAARVEILRSDVASDLLATADRQSYGRSFVR